MKKKRFLILLSTLLLIFSTNTAYAADKTDPMLFLYSVVGTTETYVDLDAKPGEKATFSIQLSNSGTTTKTNSLFVSDGLTANNGGTMVITPKEAHREKAGSWFNITEQSITLKPGQKKTFDFVVNVPEDASLGTHVAVIYLRSEVQEGVTSDQTNNGASFVINEAYSLSSAVIIRTGGTANYDFIIEDNMQKEWIKNKDLSLFFNIKNTGNIYDYPNATVQVFDKEDNIFFEQEKELGVIYPDNSCKFNYMIPPENYTTEMGKVVVKLSFGKPRSKTIEREFGINVSSEEIETAKTKIEEEQNEEAKSAFEEEDIPSSKKLPGFVAILIIGLLLVIAVMTLIVHFAVKRKKRSRFIKGVYTAG